MSAWQAAAYDDDMKYNMARFIRGIRIIMCMSRMNLASALRKSQRKLTSCQKKKKLLLLLQWAADAMPCVLDEPPSAGCGYIMVSNTRRHRMEPNQKKKKNNYDTECFEERVPH